MLTKITMLAAVVVAMTGAATAMEANAAVFVNVSQDGSNVILTASGTFDRTITKSTPVPVGGIDTGVNPSLAYVGLGTSSPGSVYTGLMGPTSFGKGGTTNTFSATGIAIGFEGGNDGSLFISNDYVDNTPIVATGTIALATLSSLGLTAGVYNYLLGGNAVTLNIGQAATSAVPEAATWAMMMVGLGMVGGSLRRRQNVRTQVQFA